MSLDETELIRLNDEIWDLNKPVILIRTNPAQPHLHYLTSVWSEVYGNVRKHSSNGWSIKDEYSDVLIYGCFSYIPLGRESWLDNYCLGTELVTNNTPDLIRLAEAMHQSLALLRINAALENLHTQNE